MLRFGVHTYSIVLVFSIPEYSVCKVRRSHIYMQNAQWPAACLFELWALSLLHSYMACSTQATARKKECDAACTIDNNNEKKCFSSFFLFFSLSCKKKRTTSCLCHMRIYTHAHVCTTCRLMNGWRCIAALVFSFVIDVEGHWQLADLFYYYHNNILLFIILISHIIIRIIFHFFSSIFFYKYCYMYIFSLLLIFFRFSSLSNVCSEQIRRILFFECIRFLFCSP